ncbi:hypothetical protein Tco_0216411 [Tanacetum coccineum]
MKRVSKTIRLLNAVAKINDPQSGDVLNYAFIASRLQSDTLQTKLLRHVGIVAFGYTFDEALCVFNNAMEIDFLSNPSEVAAPKLMKKMADIYFTRIAKNAKSSFSLSPRQMALWQSQREDHTSDWLRVVPISGLGQTMNGDIYVDHDISCAGIIGIKHRHNAVRDTLLDICFRSGISAGKEVDIGLGPSPLTLTEMADFVPGRAVLEVAQRKRAKYEAKCADIGYGFFPFSFSSFGELEKDAVTLLKRIRKFSVAQDIGARTAIHIFNRISFSIAKGVGPNRGLDVCVDLRGSSPLTQIVMTCFVPGRVMIDAAKQEDAIALLNRIQKFYVAQDVEARAAVHIFSKGSKKRKRKADAVSLLKRIQKFSMTQDIGACAALHIFNKISFTGSEAPDSISAFI